MSATTVICASCHRRVPLRWDNTLGKHRRPSKNGYAPWCSASGREHGPSLPPLPVSARPDLGCDPTVAS